MDSLLHIGNKMDNKATGNLSRLLRDIMESGFKNHSTDAVVVKALDVCEKAFDITGTSVQYCTFTGSGVKKKGE